MGLILDLRYAMRLLARSPGFTLLTSLILMGGLAVSLVCFNFVYTLAFSQLDTPDGKSIVAMRVTGQYPKKSILVNDLHGLESDLFKQLYSDYALHSRQPVHLSFGEIGKDLPSQHISSNFFSFTRFEPMLGRHFNLDDQQAGNAKVAALSHRLWQSMFMGDPQIIGKTVLIDGQATEVVAIMPQGYLFPANNDLWLPMSDQQLEHPSHPLDWIDIIARLKPQVSLQDANDQVAQYLLTQTFERLSVADQADLELINVVHQSLPHKSMGDEGRVLLIGLQGVALAILLMAGINAGNLIFARAIERQKETAIRSALGATKKRLIRQLIVEGTLLTLIGGLLALLLSGWLLNMLDHIMRSITNNKLPFWWQWQLDGPTVLVAVIFMLFTLVFACLLPAVKAVNMDINQVLRDGTRGALSKASGKTAKVLVTVQITVIAILMLVGSLSGSLIYQIINDINQQDHQHQYQTTLKLDPIEYAEPHQRATMVTNLVEQLKSRQHIDSAAIYTQIGPSSIQINPQDPPQRIDRLLTDGDLTLFGQKLIAGRTFNLGDNHHNNRVVMVSESFAARYWPEVNPLDQTLMIDIDDAMVAHKVVGIINDISGNTQGYFAAKERFDEIYLAYYQQSLERVELTMKTTDQAAKGEENFYQLMAMLKLNGQHGRLIDVARQNDVTADLLVVSANVIIYCGLFALFLALMGVYGVAANAVVMRRQEIGIRRALGAKDKRIIRLFLKRNIGPLAIGLSIGLLVYAICCFIFSQLVLGQVQIQLYISIGLVSSLLLTLMLMLAAYLPTRRAIKQEPAVSLRAD
jgi:predicted permease